MEPLLTPDDMALTDQAMMNELHISESVLIERAAIAARDVIISHQSKFNTDRILIVCGLGNNGADGLALARLLFELSFNVRIFIAGDINKTSVGFKNQLRTLQLLNIPILKNLEEAAAFSPGLIIDSIFGISLNRDITGDFEKAVKMINELHDLGLCKVIALDMPSGINSKTGAVMGIAVMADMTITFGYRKVGAYLYPGAQFAGEIIYCKSGFFDAALKINNKINIFSDDEICFPKRNQYSNKGTFGKLLLIAGSSQICGALILSALAAMRSGLGMLKVVTARENCDRLLAVLPEAMILSYDDEIPEEELSKALKWCDCAAIGPGITTEKTAAMLVDYVFKHSEVPIVADADALNIIAKKPEYLTMSERPLVITPHLGEMSRLSKISINEISSHLIETALDFANAYNIIVVLKDARTVIASPNGEAILNINGNSGMASAGSGDVLTGIIGAIIAGGMDPFRAAALACAIHAKAGDIGSFELSEPRLLAGDLIKYVKFNESKS